MTLRLSEEEYAELCEFVKTARFERLGCFAFSAEEGTVAARLPHQVDEEAKVRRAEIIMDIQSRVVAENNDRKLGTVQEVLVEGYDDYIKCYFGRTAADAPEIDAKVFFCTEGVGLADGDMVQVEINDTIEYDLLGEIKTEE